MDSEIKEENNSSDSEKTINSVAEFVEQIVEIKERAEKKIKEKIEKLEKLKSEEFEVLEPLKILKILKILTELNRLKLELVTKKEIFFRGHSDKEYTPEPFLFRNPRFLKNEKNLFNDLITQCPEEFAKCHFTFEYLVKMQHYGLPTRLLDITSNALVALYFACQKDKDKNTGGEVLIYQVNSDSIKNYDSDTVSVLSNLSKMDNDFVTFTNKNKSFFKESRNLYQSIFNDYYKIACDLLHPLLLKVIETSKSPSPSFENYDEIEKNILNKLFQQTPILSDLKNNAKNQKIVKKQIFEEIICRKHIDLIKNLSNNLSTFKSLHENNLEFSQNLTLKRLYPSFENQISELFKLQLPIQTFDIFEKLIRLIISLQDTEKEIYKKLAPDQNRFISFIQQEKSYFVDRIQNNNDVQKIICVRAQLNNQRIIKQSGLFFLFGMIETKEETYNSNNYNTIEKYTSDIKQLKNPRLIIPANQKQKILNELRMMGISEETLFPEIDMVARSITKHYATVPKHDASEVTNDTP